VTAPSSSPPSSDVSTDPTVSAFYAQLYDTASASLSTSASAATAATVATISAPPQITKSKAVVTETISAPPQLTKTTTSSDVSPPVSTSTSTTATTSVASSSSSSHPVKTAASHLPKKLSAELQRWQKRKEELAAQLATEQEKLERERNERKSQSNADTASVQSQVTPLADTHTATTAAATSTLGDSGPTDTTEREKAPTTVSLATAEDEKANEEESFIQGTICLLCQRELLTPEKLQKHLTSSELHRKNLEAWRAQRAAKTAESTTTYRDRAAERRQRDGIPEPDPNASYRTTQRHGTKRPVHDIDNSDSTPSSKIPRTDSSSLVPSVPPTLEKGARMLMQMGWTGGGLGAHEKGRVDPIEVKIRAERAGLGSEEEKDSSTDVYPFTGTYQDAARRKLRQRFFQMYGADFKLN
jgi:hypothetical protein